MFVLQNAVSIWWKKEEWFKKLVEFQHNIETLTKIADEICPFLTECCKLDSWSLDVFNKEFHGLIVHMTELTAIWVCKKSSIMMSNCVMLEIINFF